MRRTSPKLLFALLLAAVFSVVLCEYEHDYGKSGASNNNINQRQLQNDGSVSGTELTIISTTTTCPVYRIFDSNRADVPVNGAPDGCFCLNGLSGLNCGYCNPGNDAPCQQQEATTSETASSICQEGMVHDNINSENNDRMSTNHKAYKCRLYDTLGKTLFTNGKASFYLDYTDASASISLFDTRSVNDDRTLDCSLSGCVFDDTGSNNDGTGTRCNATSCSCQQDQCSPWIEQILQDNINSNNSNSSESSSKAAQIVVNTNPESVSTFGGIDEYQVSVLVEGIPFIEARCTASACTGNAVVAAGGGGTGPSSSNSSNIDGGNTGTNNNINGDSKDEEDSATFKGSAQASVVILASIFALLVVVVVFGLLPLLWERTFEEHGGAATGADADQSPLVPVPTSDKEHDATQVEQPKHLLQFQHLSRSVQLTSKLAIEAHGQKEKVILNNISGSVESGTVLGIMGPSGAGKSSLLNVLAAVEGSGKNARVSGRITLNGKEQMQGYHRSVGYVYQDDALYETLTVKECIEYSALMRLPRDMSLEAKHALVWKTLDELHLRSIAHNRIGTSGHASISGGERKRVSVGMVLVAAPTILVFDEPTSGLDSSNVTKFMTVLSELASRNRIVLLSIHQPSMKSFLMMDQILLLGGGEVIYNGKPSEVKGYLESKGFPLPENDTVADFMLEVVSDEGNRRVLKAPMENATAYDKLRQSSGQMQSSSEVSEETLGGEKYAELSTGGGSLLTEFTVLFGRTARETFRNLQLFLTQLVLSIGLAVFGGAVFNDVSNDLAGFQNRLGAFFSCLTFFGFASFSSMDIFVRERRIFERETGAKMYRAFPYFIAKVVLDTFFLRVIPATIFSFVFYWFMGLDNEIEKFVIFWTTLVLFNICAGVISICISIASPSLGVANLFAVVWFLIMLLFGGFLINIESMDPWFAWLKYLSIFFYGFELLVTNELAGLRLTFDAPGFPTLPIRGEVYVETIGMNIDNQSRDLVCLCSLAIGYAALAYVLLLRRVPRSASSFFVGMQLENEKLARSDTSSNS